MKFDYPIVVIGAGAGGLVVAIGAAKAGKKVLLIENGNFGGDCTNFGCIPSKTLISSAHHAHSIESGKLWGLKYRTPKVDGSSALSRVQQVVKGFVDHEGPDELKKHGVDTLQGLARFKGPNELIVELKKGGEKEVTARQIVIATGSHPWLPPIDGLDANGVLTNETIFDLTSIPESLGVIGGGAIGVELAQAFSRLGARVTIIEVMDHLLFREEPEAIDVIEEQLKQEGIALSLGVMPTKVTESKKGELTVHLEDESKLSFDKLLVAVGRRPNIQKLDLGQASIDHDPVKGIKVDRYGRTSQRHIWAVGDVVGRFLFTHEAEFEARSVLTNLILPWGLKRPLEQSQLVPRVTFSDPEVASIGPTHEVLLKRYGPKKLAVYTIPFSDVDRAVTEGRTEGFVKIITRKLSSRILSATVVGPRAGEMLMEISVCIQHRIPLRKLANLIHPYPIYSHAIRKAADKWLTETVLPSARGLFDRWLHRAK